MKKISAVLLFMMATFNVFPESNSGDPKELVQAREEYARQAKRACEPIKKKYLQYLEDLKKRLGAKGDIEGAMAVQNEIKDISSKSLNEIISLPESKETAQSAKEKEDGDNPDSDQGDPFKEKLWLKSMRIKSGEYTVGTELITIKNEKDKPAPLISVEKGALCKDGNIFISQGSIIAKKAKFANVGISVELGGYFEATDCIFEKCSFAKGGGWFVALWSSRWKFKNCVFTEKFFTGWDSVNVGVIIENCTFYGITFPTFNYRDDAGKECQDEQRTIKDCRFVDCAIPESVLAATKSCQFQNCEFLPDKEYNYKTSVNVNIYVNNTKGDMPKGNDNLKFNVVKSTNDDKSMRGSNIKYNYKKP